MRRGTSTGPGRHRLVLGRVEEARDDTQVVAAGATHSHVGKDQLAELAPGMKTVEDARYLRDGVDATAAESPGRRG